jgi:D-alanyl-D-alanine carboxypeptidase (penicillin-binding protein 5/6)
LAALVALALALAPVPAAAQKSPPKDLPAASWILVDEREGDVLAKRHPRRAAPTASTTKLMTAYLAIKALRPKDVVTAPRYRANPVESVLGLQPGERITVRDLLYGLLLASGNDAAVALARAVSGSQAAFVRRMNTTAAALKLTDTRYEDPIGIGEGNVSSPRDLARLAAVLREIPLFRRIVDTPRATLTSGAVTRTVVNRNTLVRSVPWVDGVKTGYTLAAGNVLVASGERRGVPLVSVVMGAPSEAARDAASLELLRYGASLYERRSPVRKGEEFAAVPLRFRDERLPLLAARELLLVVRRDQKVETRVRAPEEVDGPIEEGEMLGRVTVLLDGERVASAGLVAARSVEAAGLLDRVDSALPGGRAVVWIGVVAVAGLILIALLSAARRRRG